MWRLLLGTMGVKSLDFFIEQMKFNSFLKLHENKRYTWQTSSVKTERRDVGANLTKTFRDALDLRVISEDGSIFSMRDRAVDGCRDRSKVKSAALLLVSRTERLRIWPTRTDLKSTIWSASGTVTWMPVKQEHGERTIIHRIRLSFSKKLLVMKTWSITFTSVFCQFVPFNEMKLRNILQEVELIMLLHVQLTFISMPSPKAWTTLSERPLTSKMILSLYFLASLGAKRTTASVDSLGGTTHALNWTLIADVLLWDGRRRLQDTKSRFVHQECTEKHSCEDLIHTLCKYEIHYKNDKLLFHCILKTRPQSGKAVNIHGVSVQHKSKLYFSLQKKKVLRTQHTYMHACTSLIKANHWAFIPDRGAVIVGYGYAVFTRTCPRSHDEAWSKINFECRELQTWWNTWPMDVDGKWWTIMDLNEKKIKIKTTRMPRFRILKDLQGGEQLFGAHTHFQREYTDRMWAREKRWWRWRRNVSFSLSAFLSLFSAFTLLKDHHISGQCENRAPLFFLGKCREISQVLCSNKPPHTKKDIFQLLNCYTHTCITHIHTQTQTQTHIHIVWHLFSLGHTHTHTAHTQHTQTDTERQTHTHTHTNTHACTHAHTHK